MRARRARFVIAILALGVGWASLPFLLGVFAGAELLGLLGLVLGPLAVAYCLELVRLYEAEYGVRA